MAAAVDAVVPAVDVDALARVCRRWRIPWPSTLLALAADGLFAFNNLRRLFEMPDK